MKLNNCPFCGRKASIEVLDSGITNIACGTDDEPQDTCGCVLFGGSRDSKRKMIEKWNRRAELNNIDIN